MSLKVSLASHSTDRDIKRYVESWESNAKEDALFAILTDNKKRHGSWTVGKFFESGREEIDIVFNYLKKKITFTSTPIINS